MHETSARSSYNYTETARERRGRGVRVRKGKSKVLAVVGTCCWRKAAVDGSNTGQIALASSTSPRAAIETTSHRINSKSFAGLFYCAQHCLALKNSPFIHCWMLDDTAGALQWSWHSIRLLFQQLSFAKQKHATPP